MCFNQAGDISTLDGTSKSMNKKSKPGWQIPLKIQMRNLQNQAKMIKTKEKRWNNVETKRKKNNTTWVNKPESNDEIRKIKKIWKKI